MLLERFGRKVEFWGPYSRLVWSTSGYIGYYIHEQATTFNKLLHSWTKIYLYKIHKKFWRNLYSHLYQVISNIHVFCFNQEFHISSFGNTEFNKTISLINSSEAWSCDMVHTVWHGAHGHSFMIHTLISVMRNYVFKMVHIVIKTIEV